MCRIRITTVQDLDLCAIITDRLHLFVSPFAKIKGGDGSEGRDSRINLHVS